MDDSCRSRYTLANLMNMPGGRARTGALHVPLFLDLNAVGRNQRCARREGFRNPPADLAVVRRFRLDAAFRAILKGNGLVGRHPLPGLAVDQHFEGGLERDRAPGVDKRGIGRDRPVDDQAGKRLLRHVLIAPRVLQKVSRSGGLGGREGFLSTFPDLHALYAEIG